jgi:hypothetical protein
MSLVDEMPAFGSHTVCPKCGGECMIRKYKTMRLIGDTAIAPEFIQVMCGGCGFDQMTEKTKDAPLSV